MRETKKQGNGGLREQVYGGDEYDIVSTKSSSAGRSAEALEPRQCSVCKSKFKTLPTSKQECCSVFCHIKAGYKSQHQWQIEMYSLLSELRSKYNEDK